MCRQIIRFLRPAALLVAVSSIAWTSELPLQQARDKQDRAALTKIVSDAGAQLTSRANDPEAHYRLAVAQSTLAEVAMEVRDKQQARGAADAGMAAAEKAVALKPDKAEYHRILGTLCGQAAAAVGGLSAFKYGRCALEEVNKAVQLDPKAAINHLSHGVGNYYLPAALGGGIELALDDFKKALALDAKSADTHLWMGLALRKANQMEEAKREFKKAVELNPSRVWAQQQLAKTP